MSTSLIVQAPQLGCSFLRHQCRALVAATDLSGGFQRPETIKWDRDLANNVSLIGFLGKDPAWGYSEQGRIVYGSIKTPHSWFLLDFCDPVSEIAVEHAKKGDWVQVQGELLVPKPGDKIVTPKVLVKDFKFVEKSNDSKIETARLWLEFFAAPNEWWDNRAIKRNARAPDFKHKETREALWLNSQDLPSWIPSQIQALESKGILKR
ncbi:protein OSB1, mitochondrial-like [Selaginella moellendorffii]|uniref:protein OSB1, mitochondrial-like n=1 Tax=Selaginella moellendorffii TaxID=88036 RepID=UPI000D1CC1A0|nr:protein OSB1, mitochondrial-like [Selaginella moellendorffii]|eukprot:XP_024528399.1 protein OSB1, mitochondrial-like [Selaginella moellendorffii]